MTLGQVVLLAVVQGITEFFPISSDGHLTLFQAFLEIREASLALDVALHVGTLGSILFFFRKDIAALLRGLLPSKAVPSSAPVKREILAIIVVTFFTGIVGLSLKKTVEASVASYAAAGWGFLLTAAFLALGAWRLRSPQKYSPAEAPWWNLVVLGIVQGAAVWPGLSRSGSTIATALLLGWRWESAGRFSFLMSIPAVVGATLLTAKDMAGLDLRLASAGIIVSFITGCLALYGLMKFLAAKRLEPFAIYCLAVGIWALSRA